MNSRTQHRDRSPELAPVVWALIAGTVLPAPLLAGIILLMLQQLRFDLLAVISAIFVFGDNGAFLLLGLLALTVIVLTGLCAFVGFVVASLVSMLANPE
jgi:hypothetical protein